MTNRPNLTRLGVLAITGASSGGKIWDFAESPTGDYLYAAASGDGIYTFNITDPENPTLEGITSFDESSGVEFEGECTDIVLNGTDLFVCGRSITWNSPNTGDANNAKPGCLAKYDVSGANESSPSWTSAYTFPDRLFYRTLGTGNVWPQGIDTDGTYIYAACQYDGLYLINASTMAYVTRYGWDELAANSNFYDYTGTATSDNFVLIDAGASFPDNDSLYGKTLMNVTKRWFGKIDAHFGTTVLGANPREPSTNYVANDIAPAALWTTGDTYAVVDAFFYWETSRIVYSDGWVYMANHGNGVMACDVGTTPGSVNASNVTFIDVPERDGSQGAVSQLRPRNVWVDREWLYATPNTTTGNEPDRGLMVAHIPADPSTMTRADWYNYEIGEADNDDPWTGKGDRPLMGGTFKDKYFYIANGQRGLAVFNILDPTDTPGAGDVTYQGTFGTGSIGTANLYSAAAVTRAGKTYLYYGDAFQTSALQEHNLYYDLLEPEGKKMFTIGYHGSTGTVNTAFILDDRAICASVTANGHTYTAEAGDVVDYYEIRVKDSSGAKDWSVCLYEVESNVPTNIVPGSIVTITNSNTTGTDVRTLQSAAVSIGLTEGAEYTVGLANLTGAAGAGNPTVISDGTTNTSRRDSTVTSGAFNNPFTNSAAFTTVAASAVGSNGGSGSTGTILSTII